MKMSVRSGASGRPGRGHNRGPDDTGDRISASLRRFHALKRLARPSHVDMLTAATSKAPR